MSCYGPWGSPEAYPVHHVLAGSCTRNETGEVWSALRITGARSATARRWWVQTDTPPGMVSGLNDLNASSMVSSGGISPFLGRHSFQTVRDGLQGASLGGLRLHDLLPPPQLISRAERKVDWTFWLPNCPSKYYAPISGWNCGVDVGREVTESRPLGSAARRRSDSKPRNLPRSPFRSIPSAVFHDVSRCFIYSRHALEPYVN